MLLAGCATAPPVPPSQTRPSDSDAVVALLDSAAAEQRAGQLPASAAALERALRIEPRNPYIWHRLARLRLQEGNYAQAAGLAAKSNALAGGDDRLRAANWRMIGEARRQTGDQAGADAAFAEAERLGR
jgi:cytochrome c-type biogenesis protein CcmH/NrfG